MVGPHIALEISSVALVTGSASVTYHVRLGKEVRRANIQLTEVQIEEMEAIGRTYASLFDPQRSAPPQVRSAQLDDIGERLFRLWLKGIWEQVMEGAPPTSRRLLLIASNSSDVLNLPWELLKIPSDPGASMETCWPVGVDRSWGICRYPSSRLPNEFGLAGDVESRIPTGRLRVLFLSSSPKDFPELDYEGEEEAILAAIESSSEFEVEIGDLGTFKELESRVASFRPHIVHLSGHATSSDEGAAFVFETESGDSDRRPARSLTGTFLGSGVRCVFVSGCGSAIAPHRDLLGGICQSLVAKGIPLAVGWAATIADEMAVRTARTFYSTLMNGQSVDYALASARLSARESGPVSGDPSWSLPVLYTSVPTLHIHSDSVESGQEPARPRSDRLNRRLPGISFARELIGRRRELQGVLPGLRDGTNTGIVITGMEGSGKSSFATRLVRRLEADRHAWILIVVSGESCRPYDTEALFGAAGFAFQKAKKLVHADLVGNKDLKFDDRLRALIDGLNEGRFILVLDGFDNNLDHASRKFLDNNMSLLYRSLLAELVGPSLVVVTTRFLPVGDKLPKQIVEVNLGELSETSFLRFLLRDSEIRRKYSKDVSRQTLLNLRSLFGSAPAFLAKMRGLLRNTNVTSLPDEIKGRIRSRRASLGPALTGLEALHDEYCSSLKLGVPFQILASHTSSTLCRAAVHAGPLSVTAAAAIGGCSSTKDVLEEIERGRGSAFLHVEMGSSDRLWSIYGTLRRWLAAPDRLADRDWQDAHFAAAKFFHSTASALKNQEKQKELQLNKVDCLLAARLHFLWILEGLSALEISKELNEILIAENRYDEIIELNRELCEYIEHPEPATWIAKAYLRRPDYESAQCWYSKALALAGDEHPLEKGHALQGLAIVKWHKDGDASQARDYLTQAIDIQQKNKDRDGEAMSLHQLGSIDFDLNDYPQARLKFNDALKVFAKKEGAEIQATLHQLGSIELEEGKLGEARAAFERALKAATYLKDTRAQAAAIHQLGRLAAKIDPWNGLLQLRNALEIRQKIGDGSGEAQTFRRMGEILAENHHIKPGLNFLIVSLYLYDTLGDENRKLLAVLVQKAAQQLGQNEEALSRQKEEVQQNYLNDRGTQLVRATFQLKPRSVN